MPFFRLFFIVLLYFSLFGCNKAPKEITHTDLYGTWQERETPGSFAGTNYRIVFKPSDSVYVAIETYTDAIDLNDPCLLSPVEYIRGTFAVHNNQISIAGKNCDSSFTFETTDCRGNSSFSANYPASYTNEVLVLYSDAPEEWQKIKLYRVR